jgi:DNA topoisomerase-2
MTEAAMNDALRDGLHKKFKLTTTVSTSNMHLFNKDGVICKYDTPTQILEEFFHVRLDGYTRRRAALIRTCESEMCRLDNKMRFILGVVKGDIKVRRGGV